MDIVLGKITQQAMNYAIRSGITITASFAIRQSARLLKQVKGNERLELQALQERLNSKIKIISPAIDMIELISARGNTSLESAVSLTKALRWDIQSLGQRLASAANAEEMTRRGSSNAKSRVQNDIELKLIIQDIRNLLSRIEDAVPLINLAITTSGASLSTNLPASISPSRLLQASTFLTAGDTQYSLLPTQAVQIGPTFTLSMYMLFSGHVRPQDEEGLRETTWKEVIHKARVKLLRVPLNMAYDLPGASRNGRDQSHTNGDTSSAPYSPMTGEQSYNTPRISGEAYADEFAYQLLIIEDFDDDRMHSFEDDEVQPGPYEDVSLAGIREVVPIHEISKIFYADTGKILNIGNEEEPNSPVLLLRRDVNAIPPRRMMERFQTDAQSDEEEGEHTVATNVEDSASLDGQSEIDAQLQREHLSSSVMTSSEPTQPNPITSNPWRLPADLDPEWMAFEVYVEPDDTETESTSEAEINSEPPSRPSREQSLDPQMTTALSNLHLNDNSSSPPPHQTQQLIPQPPMPIIATAPSPFPNIRTSLSLLETLLRLSSLQQFQQTSHLAINDELLHFFLEESSTTGAGGDAEERRRVRREARARVGFDPYDESPVKRRGEEYQYQYQYHGGREGRSARESIQGSEVPRWDTHPNYEGEGYGYSSPSPRWDEGDRYDVSLPHPHPHSHPYLNQNPTTTPQSRPQPSDTRDHTPSTPPLLLKNSPSLNRSSSSRSASVSTSVTPDKQHAHAHAQPAPPPLGARGYSSPPTTKSRHALLRRDMATAPKRGSPLGEREKERPRTGLTDEGLGTSPGFPPAAAARVGRGEEG
ncbi:hypothetical protein MMC16_004123 [Acarospora aff. strigata]|nr:hypothetical protein [Acarospora aff. strigata]